MMTTVLETNANPSVPSTVSAMQDIPLKHIQESKTNPRRQFDETQLAELAENIRLHGVLQPVLVRPLESDEAGRYELVAGARRFRASTLANRETIPACIRELTDTECLELQLIENLQRADVHELDEARGYADLMRLQPETYTVETLAEKIGRPEKYVYARLRLMQLILEAQEAFYIGRLTVAHAFEIARLQPADQKRALQECFPNHKTAAAVLKDAKAEAVTVRQLRAWVEQEIHLDLTSAPFDPQDETLFPQAGSCVKCPKRTGNNPLLFPEVRQKSICTDRACYRTKIEALIEIRMKPLEAAGEKPLRVSHTPAWQVRQRNPDVLYEGHYRTVKKAECPQTRPAVVTDGPDAGKVLHVCRDEKCTVHARVSSYQPTQQERAARAKELLAERVEKESRVRILNAVRKKLPKTLSRPDLEMAVLDYFERLGVTVMAPGEELAGESTEMLAHHKTEASEMDAYEILLGDAMKGDAMLFARQDYVEEAWRIVDPILKVATPVNEYEPGVWGPQGVATDVVPPGGWKNPVIASAADAATAGSFR